MVVMAEITEGPACGCNGCAMVQLGRETHMQIIELRKMIDEREERLGRVHAIAGNNEASVIREPEFPDRYPKGRY